MTNLPMMSQDSLEQMLTNARRQAAEATRQAIAELVLESRLKGLQSPTAWQHELYERIRALDLTKIVEAKE